jgi:hypothetical protein
VVKTRRTGPGATQRYLVADVLGGRESAEGLAAADGRDRARQHRRNVQGTLAGILVLSAGVAYYYWDALYSEPRNLIWLVPLALLGGTIWYFMMELIGNAFAPFSSRRDHYRDEDEMHPAEEERSL